MLLTIPKGLRGGSAGVDIFIFTMRKVIWNYLIEFIKLIVTLSAYRVPVTVKCYTYLPLTVMTVLGCVDTIF